MNEVTIRTIEKQEVEQLVELCRQHALFEQAAWDDNGKADRLQSYLFREDPSLYCLVAVKDGKLIGYTTYMKQFSTWDAGYYLYMDCLYLTEESRGLGIGPKLIEHIREEGRKMGIDLIQWQTPDFNTRAIKFYDRIGAQRKTKERCFLQVW